MHSRDIDGPLGWRRSSLPAALLLLSFAMAGWGADVSGSRDPLDLARMPHSWIVAYENDEALLPREYALGRVDKTRRNVRVEHEVRAAAAKEWATYEMPSGTQPDEVIEHYLGVLDTEPLFSCHGRDCGRSNLWANEVFKRATLYGPDANQFYFAGEKDGALVALYVIKRGNRRVYAHLEVLRPEQQVAVGHNAEALERLAGDGHALVEGVTPDRLGQLDDAEIALLDSLAEGMAVFAGQTVYVVCHLYGSESSASLIERSQSCAEIAADILGSNGEQELVPFGAGPLLPRVGLGARIELILPHRLSH
jgi:hypothetical protein